MFFQEQNSLYSSSDTISSKRHIMCKHEHTSSLTMFVEMSICCPIQAPCLRGYNDVIISYWLENKDFNRLYNTHNTVTYNDLKCTIYTSMYIYIYLFT